MKDILQRITYSFNKKNAKKLLVFEIFARLMKIVLKTILLIVLKMRNLLSLYIFKKNQNQ